MIANATPTTVQSIGRTKKRKFLSRLLLLLAPLAWAVFPVMFLAARNITEPDIYSQLAGTIALVLLATVVVFVLLVAVINDDVLASALMTLAVGLFFLYGHIHQLAASTGYYHPTVISSTLGRQIFLLPAYAVVFVGLSVVLYKSRKYVLPVVQGAALAGLVLGLFNGALILEHIVSVGSGDTEPTTSSRRITVAHPWESELPDIYYFILDGYGREDVLREAQGFDNSEFINYLETKGFIIPDNAVSNYASTTNSIPSSLNMVHLAGLSPDEVYKMRRLPRQQSAAVRVADEIGYRFLHYESSDWNREIVSRSGFVSYVLWSPFTAALAQTSLLRVVWGHMLHIEQYWADTSSGTSFPEVQKNVAAVAKLPGATFTVSYNLPPHPPYIFAADGSLRDPVIVYDLKFGGEGWAESYVGQIQYVNVVIMQTIDSILADSNTPPIIIVQADHGPRQRNVNWLAGREDGLDVFWERMGILNAYLLPERCKDAVYRGITPVNTFRSVFNRCFGTDFPLLPDISYWGIGEEVDFQVVDPFAGAPG